VRRAGVLLFAAVIGFAGAAHALDADRVEGGGKEIKGNVEEKTGQLLGNRDLEQQGSSDRSAGQVQSAWGKFKDAMRDIGAAIENKLGGK
jgi:uncharacterized protein YjbJ (UPF0337 family)